MSKVTNVFASSIAALAFAGSHPAAAQSASVSLDSTGATASSESAQADAQAAGEVARAHRAWLQAGVFGGVLFLSDEHSLYRQNHEPFSSPVPELGARLAFLPWSFLGVEAEGLGAPTSTANTDESAGLWSIRGHLLVQVPGETFTPFAVAGGGALGAGSNPTGSDIDRAAHFGLGAKLAFDDFVGVRLDLRDVISAKHSLDDADSVHNPEVLLGLSFNLDFHTEPKPVAPPADADQDGIEDGKDRCPDSAGPAPLGCPAPKDTDQDGFIDDKDACPTEKGEGPVGCPNLDRDNDCVDEPADKCPDQAGIQPDGCPDPDTDRDGVLGASDKCPNEQETKNGFEDQDGCPDTLPEKVKKFSGVIAGIEFDFGKATIRPGSTPVLTEAASVLKEYPALRVAISGHTDNVGDAKKNIDLSKERADSVKAFLVSQGIVGERIDTRGAGPDEPIADNKTAAGRQKNRRIEFKLLSE